MTDKPEETTGSGQPVVVNIAKEADNHGWQVLGTIIAGASIGSLAWAVSDAGWAELAATGLTIFLIQLGKMMLSAGLLVIPEGGETGNREIDEAKSTIRVLYDGFVAWVASSSLFRLCLLAILYTIGFLLARAGMQIALTVFSNIFVAGAAAGLVVALIVSPTLFTKAGEKLKTRTAKGGA